MCSSDDDLTDVEILGQAHIDLLLTGDITVQYLTDTVQRGFAGVAKVSITISEMKKVPALWDNRTFNIVFLKMTSLPTTEELEAVDSIRFHKMKNKHLMFVSIIPENFEDCFAGYGADINLTEPLTMEKISIVVKYWKAYFSNTVKSENSRNLGELELPWQNSCSEQLEYFSTDILTCSEPLKTDTQFEIETPLSDFKKNKKISLHSSKEKLRRERIKYCCEQLRTLLPYIKGRKNDIASILEATVEYVKYIREKIPSTLMAQITETLQNNMKFCKKQVPIELSLPSTIMAQRESSVLTNTYSPMREIRFLANKCLNMSQREPSEEGVRGQYGSTPENAVEDMDKNRIPSPALSLNSFHSVSYYSKIIPSYDAAAVTNQTMSIHFPSTMPKVSTFLSQHCSSVLGQTCTTHPNCLVSILGYWIE
ncbi:spermatogenesis- and oogenesis-specific basic helix-loop-helix-containing protein 2 [Suncus etruscus]|uniref:spermatogenesis- and oogenesis-specific basic helix-loop-helix-containing protein 2 n=1 Tax=Suncus etruscus TaxID=109475 RepID=UPI00211065B9|nr:spermatogenesis- and oogenesis-specific basic helix-loop-helix-containing protein 2 [Suncus etruscus]